MVRSARKPQRLCGWGRARSTGSIRAGLLREYTCVSPPMHVARGGMHERSARAVVLMSAASVIATMMLATTPAVAQAPAPTFDTPSGNVLPNTNVDTSQPLYLQGDELIYDTSGNSVTARGNVEIYYDNNILTADEVVYDQSANTLTAVGNVILKEPNGNIIRADRYTLTDDFRDGFVQQLSVVARDDTRIAAQRAERRDGNVTEFTGAKFSPCKTDGSMPPLWCITSQRIIHDQEAATITYQDAAFEVLGVPILYLPYFQHADPSVKRRSGFLVPQYSSSGDLGFSVETPYYFALDPSYDFTFRPRYMAKQGVLWQGDWRQRLANGQYSVKFAAIDQDGSDLPDQASEARRAQLDGFRGSLETKGQFSLSSWWKTGWDVTLESDDTFRRFYKLDSILLTDRVNRAFLEGQSDRNYFGAQLYHFGGLLLEDSNQAESRVHPVIDYNYVAKDPILGGEVKWDSNVLSLSREDYLPDDAGGQQDVNRVVTQLTWRRKMIDQIGITYEPFANLRGDIYQYNNFIDPLSGEAVDNETIMRGVASAGATISYPWIATTANASHTIEPIGQIIARTASVDQRDLPNEDAKSLVFDDTTLFDIDKFSGYDRVETGSRANVGVQYTFQLNTGGYARLLAGQSFNLAPNNPFANTGRVNPADNTSEFVNNPVSGLETDESDYVLGAYVAPTDSFRLISQSRFDDENFDVRRVDVTGLFNYGPLATNVTYAYSAIDPTLGAEAEQSDITGGVSLQLTNNWSLIGNIRYDIDDEFLLSDAIGVRYADECFILTVSYNETFFQDADRDIEPDRAIYLRFELKHLGDFSYRTDVLEGVFGDQQPPT